MFMEGKLTAVKSHREHLLFIMCVRCPTFKNVLKEQFTKKKKEKEKRRRYELNLLLQLINDYLIINAHI